VSKNSARGTTPSKQPQPQSGHALAAAAPSAAGKECPPALPPAAGRAGAEQFPRTTFGGMGGRAAVTRGATCALAAVPLHRRVRSVPSPCAQLTELPCCGVSRGQAKRRRLAGTAEKRAPPRTAAPPTPPLPRGRAEMPGAAAQRPAGSSAVGKAQSARHRCCRLETVGWQLAKTRWQENTPGIAPCLPTSRAAQA
jgi:hypothetical protein